MVSIVLRVSGGLHAPFDFRAERGAGCQNRILWKKVLLRPKTGLSGLRAHSIKCSVQFPSYLQHCLGWAWLSLTQQTLWQAGLRCGQTGAYAAITNRPLPQAAARSYIGSHTTWRERLTEDTVSQKCCLLSVGLHHWRRYKEHICKMRALQGQMIEPT